MTNYASSFLCPQTDSWVMLQIADWHMFVLNGETCIWHECLLKVRIYVTALQFCGERDSVVFVVTVQVQWYAGTTCTGARPCCNVRWVFAHKLVYSEYVKSACWCHHVLAVSKWQHSGIVIVWSEVQMICSYPVISCFIKIYSGLSF